MVWYKTNTINFDRFIFWVTADLVIVNLYVFFFSTFIKYIEGFIVKKNRPKLCVKQSPRCKKIFLCEQIETCQSLSQKH